LVLSTFEEVYASWSSQLFFSKLLEKHYQAAQQEAVLATRDICSESKPLKIN